MARLVALVFQNEVDVAIRTHGTPDCICQFGEDVGCRVVHDRMHCVQAQSVEMVFGQPIQGTMDKEIPYGPAFGPVEVDGVAPGGMVPAGEELRRIHAKIISFWAKMVVNDVQQNHDSAAMSALNQLF